MKVILNIDYEEKSLCTNPLFVSKKGNVLRCGSCLSCRLERKSFRKAYKNALQRELYKLGWSKKDEKTK
jgi:hypothetical protein